MNELALFAGAGGGLLATHHLLGWRCVGYVEMAEYPCKVLEARINDGLLSRAPIYHMHTKNFIRLGLAEKYRGVAHVITAGFPCQPFSGAGLMLGELDKRNGWPDTIAIIRLVRPPYVLLENVAKLTAYAYFGTILGDLAASGYDYRWDCIPASAVGANHQRDRVWIIAWDTYRSDGQEYTLVARAHPGTTTHTSGNGDVSDTNGIRWQRDGTSQPERRPEFKNGSPNVPNTKRLRRNRHGISKSIAKKRFKALGKSTSFHKNVAHANDKRWQPQRSTSQTISGQIEPGLRGSSLPDANDAGSQRQRIQKPTPYRDWWQTEPNVGRVVDGLAHRVDRLKALGNGQVPAVAAEVWRLLGGCC